MSVRTTSEARDYKAAVTVIVDRWVSREITLRQKQELIRELNAFVKGTPTPPGPEPEKDALAFAQSKLFGDEEEEPLWWKREPA